MKRIPSRHDYAESTRKELWSSLDEIKENALRNEAEFLFDGGDWRECCEEEDMYFDKRSGALVHPAHIEKVCVFNGTGWTPISKEETATPAQATSASQAVGLLPNEVCIVCDCPGDIV